MGESPYRIICQGDKPDLVSYHQMDTLGMALAFGAELACQPRTAYVIVQGGECRRNGLKISNQR